MYYKQETEKERIYEWEGKEIAIPKEMIYEIVNDELVSNRMEDLNEYDKKYRINSDNREWLAEAALEIESDMNEGTWREAIEIALWRNEIERIGEENDDD